MNNKMMKGFLNLILATSLTVGCSNNILQTASSSSSDDSYLLNAKSAVNASNYDAAIAIITTQMSASGQAQTATKDVLASAYAGKCGLNFVNYLQSLANATMGTAFKLMMTPYVGVAATPSSCLTALQVLDSIGSASVRTSNENAFAAVVGMSLLGAQVRVSSDTSPTNGDGTIDTTVCNMSNADIDNVILGFGYVSQNISYLSIQQLGSSTQTAINNVISKCSTLGVTCAVTDPTAITSQLRTVMKDLLNTDDYGVGNVHTGGDATLIAGACP